jgi:hypothetical protein
LKAMSLQKLGKATGTNCKVSLWPFCYTCCDTMNSFTCRGCSTVQECP